MIDKEKTREFMHSLLGVQTTFRQAIQRNMKRHNIDLTFEMLQILLYLWRKDGVNQQELASSTFKDKASLTSLLNNLEVKELVIRVEDSSDRRNKNVYLTELGKQYGQRVKPMLDEIYEVAGKKIDKGKMALCVNYLQELSNVFKEL